jgi:hypothetical protein
MGGIPSTDHSSSVVDDETFGEEGQFKVHIKMYEGFDQDERLKLKEACRMWAYAWQSAEFKDWVLNYRFQDTCMTSEEIYAVLVGDFESKPVTEKGADIEIWIKHHACASVVHSTFTHGGERWKGSEYLGHYSSAKLAVHLAHEYCRSLNFLHASVTAERSVPFAVGRKTKRMAEAVSCELTRTASMRDNSRIEDVMSSFRTSYFLGNGTL